MTITVLYAGSRPSKEKDDQIRRAAKRREGGSGFFPAGKERDMLFCFGQGPAARRALSRIRKVRGVKAGATSGRIPFGRNKTCLTNVAL